MGPVCVVLLFGRLEVNTPDAGGGGAADINKLDMGHLHNLTLFYTLKNYSLT